MVHTAYDRLDGAFFEDHYINGEFYTIYTDEFNYGTSALEGQVAEHYFAEFDGYVAKYTYGKSMFFDEQLPGEQPLPDDDAMEEDSEEPSTGSLYSTEDIDALPDSEDPADDAYVSPTYSPWGFQPPNEEFIHPMDQLLDDWLEYQERLAREEPTHPTLTDLWYNHFNQ